MLQAKLVSLALHLSFIYLYALLGVSVNKDQNFV